MAIDSEAKRKSVAWIAGNGVSPPSLVPDATPDQGWRQTVGWSYFGINADQPAAGSNTGMLLGYW